MKDLVLFYWPVLGWCGGGCAVWFRGNKCFCCFLFVLAALILPWECLEFFVVVCVGGLFVNCIVNASILDESWNIVFCFVGFVFFVL